MAALVNPGFPPSLSYKCFHIRLLEIWKYWNTWGMHTQLLLYYFCSPFQAINKTKFQIKWRIRFFNFWNTWQKYFHQSTNFFKCLIWLFNCFYRGKFRHFITLLLKIVSSCLKQNQLNKTISLCFLTKHFSFKVSRFHLYTNPHTVNFILQPNILSLHHYHK